MPQGLQHHDGKSIQHTNSITAGYLQTLLAALGSGCARRMGSSVTPESMVLVCNVSHHESPWLKQFSLYAGAHTLVAHTYNATTAVMLKTVNKCRPFATNKAL